MDRRKGTGALLVAVLAAGTVLASYAVPGVANDTASLTHQYNGPSTCIAFDSAGNLRAPQPGDCAQYGKAGQGRSDTRARNVILIIGDGMGQQEITAARNYLKGAAGRFEGIDSLTSEGLYTHHSIDRDGKVAYVTDSAASGTAWATGTKTYNGAIGVDLAGKPQRNLIERAKAAGLRTGNVSTAEIQDATPAVLGAHALNRKCYGPEMDKNSSACKGEAFTSQFRENGGWGSISEQIVETRADVTLGGGMKAFKQTVQADGHRRNTFLDKNTPDTTWTAGRTVLDNARDNGFQVATTADELDKVTRADQDHPVLGLFSDGNMKTTFKQSYAYMGGAHMKPIRCQPQDIGAEPEMAAMTRKAIDLLDDPTSDKGFFLQIESASIDKRAHGSDACGQIGETKRLDEATKIALDFAAQHDDTLVVVTADHSHATQIVYDDADNVSPVTRLRTLEGSTMSVAYGNILPDGIVPTKKADGSLVVSGSTNHTGAQLRVAAHGPGEENVLGQTDQTDLHYTILTALGLNPDAKKATDAPLPRAAAPQNAQDTCYKIASDGSFTAPAPGECAQYGTGGEKRDNSKAKNVILFLGDGMGDSEITSARNYLYGASGRLPGLDAMRYTGSYTHFALDPRTGRPDYVTDSAASGTAWATGTKTYNGAIGVDLSGKPVTNLIERAKAAGLKTGNVSTAEIQDATPAVLGAHALNRKCYGPEMAKNSSACRGDNFKPQFRENGGWGSISEQLVDTRADVTLGGGMKAFEQSVQVPGKSGSTTWQAGQTVLDNARNNGFQVTTTADELKKVKEADQARPLIGLFAPGNMPYNFAALEPTLTGAMGKATTCRPNDKHTKDIPTLAAMTGKALELLQSDKGFFLQVEGASIDKADHAADICGQIGELDDFDQAIQTARDWVRKTGEETLIIVTADHAHTSQVVYNDVQTSGLTVKLRTADGSDMSINYATAPDNKDAFLKASETHTGTQVRIGAEGPGAANVVGRTDQTDMHYTIANALDLPKVTISKPFVPSEPSTSPSATPTPTPSGASSATPTPSGPASAPAPSATPTQTSSASGSATPIARPSADDGDGRADATDGPATKERKHFGLPRTGSEGGMSMAALVVLAVVVGAGVASRRRGGRH